MTEDRPFFRGIRESITVSFAIGIFGFVFGVLAHSKGFSILLSTFMSFTIFSGAAQLASISIWTVDHIPFLTLIGTCFVICLRFFLMSASIRMYCQQLPLRKAALSLFFLIDESWALTILYGQKQKKNNEYIIQYLLGSGMMQWSCWVLGSLAGAILGRYITDPSKYGFDFAFTAIFLALLVGFWRGSKDMTPWLVAAVSAIISAYYIPGTWYIIIGALSGSIFGAWREQYKP